MVGAEDDETCGEEINYLWLKNEENYWLCLCNGKGLKVIG
jgi:hypothetical protein